MVAGATVVSLAMVGAGTALGTPSSGTSSLVLASGIMKKNVRIHTEAVKVETKGPTQVVTQEITFQPGATSGWHSHPGLVLVTVKSGSQTVYNRHCKARTYTTGESFYESPKEAVVHNKGTPGAVSVATFLVPEGAPLRTDAENPCPGIP
ncbi:MAG: cupin domain-containing protein [Acidimicrobiales bacterium]